MFQSSVEGQSHDLFQGTQAALVTNFDFATSTWPAAYAWYNRWFASHGWVPQNRFPPNLIPQVQTYTRGARESFTITEGWQDYILTPASLRHDMLFMTQFGVSPYK